MGGGNGAKAAQKRARNAEKQAGNQDKSQLKANQANSVKYLCKVCFKSLDATKRMKDVRSHMDADAKHSGKQPSECFPNGLPPE